MDKSKIGAGLGAWLAMLLVDRRQEGGPIPGPWDDQVTLRDPRDVKRFEIDAQSIRARFVSLTSERLLRLTDSPLASARNRNVYDLAITGFGGSTMDACALPEVQQYFVDLAAFHQPWLHLLRPTTNNVALLFSLHFPTMRLSTSPEKLRTRFQVTRAGQERLARMANLTSELHDLYAAPWEVTRSMARAWHAAIDKAVLAHG
jgi:hypothetical protein